MQGDFITKPLGWVISDEYDLLSHSQKKSREKLRDGLILQNPYFIRY